jgi:ABC-type cobalt transport system substrate-binding protein
MNDLEICQAYNAEPDEPQEEEKGGAIDLLKAPALPGTDSPVTITKGEKAEKVIDDAKKKKNFLGTASSAKKNTEKILGSTVPTLEDIPTPPSGGVGLLLFISLLVVFAITPVAGMGMTRLSLVWQALLGNYSIGGGGSSSSSGSSGSGNSSQSNPLPPDPLNPAWQIQGAS